MAKPQAKIGSASVSTGSAGNVTVYKPDLSGRQITAESIAAVGEVVKLVYSSSIDFLFDTVFAAQDVSYALRAEWDGCNGVKISEIEVEAFRSATSLANGQWCYVGDSEPIAVPEASADWSQAVATDLNRLQIAFPISRAEVYWAIADWRGTHSAESLSNSLGFSKSTVQGHLSALEKAGAIRSQGRPKQYNPSGRLPNRVSSTTAITG